MIRKGMFNKFNKKMNNQNNNNANNYLVYGTTGKNVERLQFILVEIVDILPNMPIINIDGVYGEETKKAVEKFQLLNSLPVTGNVDMITWQSLNNIHRKVNKKRQEDSLDQSVNVIKEGSNNNFVVDLQKYLNKIALRYPSIGALNVDGKFGPKTKAAVIEFQRLFGLTQDGVVGTSTWEAIYNVSEGQKLNEET